MIYYDPLEADFPLGDGTADTSARVRCPHCGERQEIAIDPGSGSVQAYVEDCAVCCRPWHVQVRYGSRGRVRVTVSPAD